jgi:predicted Zn-dependent protease with MMP-like domain
VYNKEMIQVTDAEFEKVIADALDTLPGDHIKQIKNIAITWTDDPTPLQREELRLRDHETLFGLYEGVPLSKRQGNLARMPDKITLFRGPLSMHVTNLQGLQEQVRHTLWHEIAHYYGLNHSQIHELE